MAKAALANPKTPRSPNKTGKTARDQAAPSWSPDETTPLSAHRLDGLEPDNLLAFMALLGLLRALETVRPDWYPRVFWDTDRHPWRPTLTLAQPQTQAAVAVAAAGGVKVLAAAHTFPETILDLKFTAAQYRVMHAQADTARQAVLDALHCDAAVKDDGATLWPTPLCLMFGQGHQHFLDRFNDVPAGLLPGKLAKLKSPPDLASPHYVATTLFRPWRREDPADGFRWDAAEDRRYALRAEDPSGDPATTQHGANRLAAIALPVFGVIAIHRRGEARVLAAGLRYGSTGEIEVTWPLWTRRASLSGIKALLAHPVLSADRPDLSALPGGAYLRVMRVRRTSVGKFFCITPAAEVA